MWVSEARKKITTFHSNSWAQVFFFEDRDGHREAWRDGKHEFEGQDKASVLALIGKFGLLGC